MLSEEFELNRIFTVNPKAKIRRNWMQLKMTFPPFCSSAGWGRDCNQCCHLLPKPLAPVGDAPFLQLLVRQLRSQGIRDLVMCTGHLADQVGRGIRRRSQMGRCDSLFEGIAPARNGWCGEIRGMPSVRKLRISW